MPVFKFTTPEGRTIRVTAPEGATQAQAFEIAQQQTAAPQEPADGPDERTVDEQGVEWTPFANQPADPNDPSTLNEEQKRRLEIFRQTDQTTPAEQEAQEIKEKGGASFPEYLMGTAPMRFAQGVADIPLGLTQAAANVTGVGDEGMNRFMQRREQNIQQGREAVAQTPEYVNPEIDGMGEAAGGFVRTLTTGGDDAEGIDPYRTAGTVAATMVPAARLAAPNTVRGFAAQGAAIGGGTGFAMPLTGEGEEPLERGDFLRGKAIQTGTGAALGGALGPVPGLVATGAQKGIGALRTLFSTEDMARKVLQGTAGSRIRDIVSRLRGYDPEDTLTPRTAGEIAAPAGSAEFSALQRMASNRNPSDRVAAQQARDAARTSEIRSFGMTDEGLDATKQFRQQQTAPLLQAAEESGALVDTAPVLSTIDDLVARHSREPAIARPLQQLRRRLVNVTEDAEVPELTAPQAASALRSVQQMMDQKGPTGARVNEAAMAQLSRIKEALEDTIAETVPAMRQYRQLFAELSQPVNRAEVGQELMGRMEPAMNDYGLDALSQRGAAFANALRDGQKLIKSSTGFRRGNMDTLFPRGGSRRQSIDTVGEDFASEANFARLAREGMQNTRETVGDAFNVEAPHLLERAFVIANSALSRIGKRRTDNLMDFLEREMTNNPQKIADLLESVPIEEHQAIQTLIDMSRTGTPAALGSQSARTVDAFED